MAFEEFRPGVIIFADHPGEFPPEVHGLRNPASNPPLMRGFGTAQLAADVVLEEVVLDNVELGRKLVDEGVMGKDVDSETLAVDDIELDLKLETKPVEGVARDRLEDDEDAKLDPGVEERRLDVQEDDAVDVSKELVVRPRGTIDEVIKDESCNVEPDAAAIQGPDEIDEVFELHETVVYIVFGSWVIQEVY